jgi:cell division protein FtsQ
MKFFFKKNALDYLFPLIGLAAVIVLIAFVGEKSAVRRCQGLVIEMSGSEEQFYLTAEDIEKHITSDGLQPLKGRLLSEVDLSRLEKKVLEIKQIEHCEAFGDLKGVIHVKVKPYIPYARIVSMNGSKDCYIDKNGSYFPLSKYHSARVLLLSGTYFSKRPDMSLEENKGLIELIKTIKNDEFWGAQVSQIHVAEDQSVSLIPVLGDQIIEFGFPEEIEPKLKKLRIFYGQIMPVKGWDRFSVIKVQYKNQVVCE